MFISHGDGAHRNVPVTTRKSGPLRSPLFRLLLQLGDLCCEFGLDRGVSAQICGGSFVRTLLLSSSEASKIDQGDFCFGGCLSPGRSKRCEFGLKYQQDGRTKSGLQEHFVHKLVVPLESCQRQGSR